MESCRDSHWRPKKILFAQKRKVLLVDLDHEAGRLIHLIPVLVLFCFLLLYLSSRIPSQSASPQLNVIGRFTEVQKSHVLAIPSLRNLQEIEKRVPKSRPHRKIADF